MKKLLTLLLCAMMINGTMSAQQLAFPGAEGFGRYTTGGRGGHVYYVTRNDDCSDANLVEGTLRWALHTGDDSPRTILFKTCGTIYLTSKLKFAHPNVSIEGQTAPGGGICVAGYDIYLCKPNVIVRHLRFRAGDIPLKSMPALDVENADHLILDHCSLTWSMEENLTMYDCDSTTVQWCIIGEGLYSSKNVKGSRAYATQWGGEHGTMHHCLITNCNNRTPRFNGVRAASANIGDHDQFVDDEFVNNVVFNWGKPNSLYGGECDTTINKKNSYNRVYMINNYFRPGPLTQKKVSSTRYFVGASTSKGMGQWLLSGNKFETSSDDAPSTAIWSDDSLAKVNADNMYGFISNASNRAFDMAGGGSLSVYERYVLKSQNVSSGIVAQNADDAYHAVVTKAGASMPRYDEEDTRLLAEAAGTQAPQYYGKTAAGVMSIGVGIINSQDDIALNEHDTFTITTEKSKVDSVITSWPFLGMRASDRLLQDTDGDGLPDSYETEKGLNPSDVTDGAMIAASGYSNLEEFLNGVADGTIDKAKYETETGIHEVPGGSTDVLSRKYYNVVGEQQNPNGSGLTIVQQKMSDGSERVIKVLKKQ